jgi:hypothetical protein
VRRQQQTTKPTESGLKGLSRETQAALKIVSALRDAGVAAEGRPVSESEINFPLAPLAAAGMLGVKEQTLAIWRTRGEGPAYTKVGRSVVYRLGEIRRFIEAQTHRPRGAA